MSGREALGDPRALAHEVIGLVAANAERIAAADASVAGLASPDASAWFAGPAMAALGARWIERRLAAEPRLKRRSGGAHLWNVQRPSPDLPGCGLLEVSVVPLADDGSAPADRKPSARTLAAAPARAEDDDRAATLDVTADPIGLVVCSALTEALLDARPVQITGRPSAEGAIELLEIVLAPLATRGWIRFVRAEADDGAGAAGSFAAPVLVTPFLYDRDELDCLARSVAGQLAFRSGLHRDAPRAIVVSAGWAQRRMFRERLLAALARVDRAPHASLVARASDALANRTNVHEVAHAAGGSWTLVEDATVRRGDVLLDARPLPILVEVPLQAFEPEDFWQAATDLCVELGGGPTASLVVHPLHQEDRSLAPKLLRTAAALPYDVVAIDTWPGLANLTGLGPFGAERTSATARAGALAASNLVSGPTRAILWGPLLSPVRPPWLAGHRRAMSMSTRLSAPSVGLAGRARVVMDGLLR